MKTILFILISIFIISCSGTKELTKSSEESPSYDSYTKSAILSPLTKSLINEIRKEKKNLQKNQKYIPTHKLVNEFNIIQIDNFYFVGAILKFNEKYDSTVIEAVGVKTVTKADKSWAVQIPLDMLEDLANYSGIDYIQIDE